MATVIAEAREESFQPADNSPSQIQEEQYVVDEDMVTIDEYAALDENDLLVVRAIFEESFPLRYGQYFYDSLRKGTYGGRALLTCIARRNGMIVGAACANREDEGSGESNVVAKGTRTYLMTLAVIPSERRRGIASVLLGRIGAWASKDENCTALYLHVIEYNNSAMQFYERLGFQRFSRVPDFYPIDGQNHDAFVYVMYLNGGEPPPPEPPGVMEQVWDWLSDTMTRVLSFAFGENAEDAEDDGGEQVKEDELV